MAKLNARCNMIMDMLGRNGEVTVSELSEHFKVTNMTIRRDLELLESREMLARTHGGAVLTRPAVVEFAFAERSRTSMAQKRAIGKACAAYVKPGMRIVFDTGTTTLEVAKAVAQVPDLTVVTSSLPVAATLYHQETIDVILLGGTVRKRDPNLSGPLTEDNLKRFRADLAILGADAISEDGLFTTDLEVANVSRCMIEAAAESIVVADAEKLRRSSFVRIAGWADVGRLIIDSGITTAEYKRLQDVVRNVDVAEV